MKSNEVTGHCRKLHNNEFHSLGSSPSIIRINRLGWIRWAGNVTRMWDEKFKQDIGGITRAKETTRKA
jgi:hypothetical protein